MAIDFEYFRRRAQQEREAAMKAVNPGARQAHLGLADAYESRVRTLVAEVRRSDIRLVSAG